MSQLNLETKLSGEYKLVISRGDGTVEETGWFKNIILDTGLDRMGITTTGIYATQYARVGTGTSTPVATQTSLDAQIAFSAATNQANSAVNSGTPLYNTLITTSFAFAQGAVVGNIAEVGIGWATTGTSLFSRALILDNTGSPTTLTLVSIDQLTVYYRITVTPVLTDTTGSVVISSTTYGYTARICNAGSFASNVYMFATAPISANGVLGPVASTTHAAGTALSAITTVPANASGTAGTVTQGSYSPGSYFRDDVWNWSISQGNATGGIQIITLSYSGNPSGGNIKYQFRFDTVIPKTNTNTLGLTVRISWTRV